MEILLSPTIMRLLLLFCLLGMELLAAVFLSRRRMKFWAYVGWGLLAAIVPVLGPFLVVLLQPGHAAVTSLSARHRRRTRRSKLFRFFQALSSRLPNF